MKPIHFALAAGALILGALTTSPLSAKIKEGAVVDESTVVLTEIMDCTEKSIPSYLLADAQGLAIIPRVIKGGLGIGVRFGRGVLLVRDDAGHWSPPSFITFTGGSLGWQIGVQATDIVLVFRNRKSVQTLLSGKLTLGADAAVTAGPVGRQVEAGADVTLRSAVYSYSMSHGLFLGIALDGTAILIDHRANAAYYGGSGQAPQKVEKLEALPESTVRLLQEVDKYTKPVSSRETAAVAKKDPKPQRNVEQETAPVPNEDGPAISPPPPPVATGSDESAR
jgi:lipid-binding SYLF domain-containing protein